MSLESTADAFFSETEEAYLDALHPPKGQKTPPGVLEEARRAHALFLSMRENVPAKDWVQIAADIEAYLREGKVPGKGVLGAVTITAMDDKGKTLR